MIRLEHHACEEGVGSAEAVAMARIAEATKENPQWVPILFHWSTAPSFRGQRESVVRLTFEVPGG